MNDADPRILEANIGNYVLNSRGLNGKIFLDFGSKNTAKTVRRSLFPAFQTVIVSDRRFLHEHSNLFSFSRLLWKYYRYNNLMDKIVLASQSAFSCRGSINFMNKFTSV